jgi:hypothetical protein
VRLADGTGGLEQSVRGLLRFEWQTRRSQKWCQPKSHRKRVKAVWFSIGEEFGQPTPNGEPFLGSKIPCRPVVPSSVPSCSTASLRFRYCSGLQLPGVSPSSPGIAAARKGNPSRSPILPATDPPATSQPASSAISDSRENCSQHNPPSRCPA